MTRIVVVLKTKRQTRRRRRGRRRFWRMTKKWDVLRGKNGLTGARTVKAYLAI